MEVVVIALRFFLVLLDSLDPRERFRGFCLGGLGLLFGATLRSTFITVKIIETIESHRRVVSK